MIIESYLAKFDAEGHRGRTLPMDRTLTANDIEAYERQGYLKISAEEWLYYIGSRGMGDNGTGYIRDPQTGKPISAPPYVASQEEQANALASSYTARVQEINNEIVAAMVDGDEDTVAELKAEKDKALAAYQKALEGLQNA